MPTKTVLRLAWVSSCLCLSWLRAEATLEAVDDPFALPRRATPNTNIPGNDRDRPEPGTRR